jgi:hypothetical protein
MENIENKLSKFLKKEEVENQEKEIKVKDGLFERHEIINKKVVTTDGRQLLKETLFQK